MSLDIKKTQVLLADDHTIVRQGLRALLEAEPDIEVVGEAADGEEAVTKAAALAPDVVVMDISMPRMNGLEATRRIVRRGPDTRVVVLTIHTCDEYVVSCLKAGAKGYLQKESASSDLVQAIRAVKVGGTYLRHALSTQAGDSAIERPVAPARPSSRPSLTPRERQILRFIAEGNTNRKIAATLGLSVKTVEAHRTRVMQKLDIHNIAGLTRYAIRHGITTSTEGT